MKTVEWYVTRYYQMMSTLLKLGLSGYDVKPRFGAFQLVCKDDQSEPLCICLATIILFCLTDV